MNITGEKIILRAIESNDNEMLFQLINDEETEFLIGGWSFPVSKQMQETWTNNQHNDKDCLRCTIEYDKTPVGVVILSDIDLKNGNAEIHVKLSKGNTRGKGFGTDAVNALTAYAFNELRLKCVYARVNEHNTASKKLFLKAGFYEEGIMKCRLFKKGKYINVISFSKINEDNSL